MPVQYLRSILDIDRLVFFLYFTLKHRNLRELLSCAFDLSRLKTWYDWICHCAPPLSPRRNSRLFADDGVVNFHSASARRPPVGIVTELPFVKSCAPAFGTSFVFACRRTSGALSNDVQLAMELSPQLACAGRRKRSPAPTADGTQDVRPWHRPSVV